MLKPHGSLWVAHTTSVPNKYIYILHHSWKKNFVSNIKAKPQNTINASKQHPITVKQCSSIISCIGLLTCILRWKG